MLSTCARILLVAAALGAGRVARGGETSPAERVSDAAELHIGVPEGARQSISVSFGEGLVALELPRGATYPLDFVAATAGLLRAGELVPLPGDRTRVNLKLAGGLLAKVDYDSTGVTLQFRRRYGAVSPSDDPKDSYLIGPEDKVQVTISGHPELMQQLVVSGGGTISAPLVGDVTAAGLTPGALSAKLVDLLARDFLVDPKVDVQVTEYRSQWVLVTGEVRTPGKIQLRGGTDLKEVLAEAGGLTNDAGQEILISRNGGADGPAQEIRVDRSAFERNESNPPLQSRDIVRVVAAPYLYFQGEVRNPIPVRVVKGMTLLRALSLAGGTTEWANKKAVQVLREGSDKPPLTYNLKAIESQKISDPPVHGGDIIIVKRRFL